MRKHSIALLGIISLGFVLRLFILSQRGSLWFDEAFSVHFASMDLHTMWEFLKFENNPPLYFGVLHFWMKLFGDSEIAVRALSMVFGLASIPLVYLVGVRLGGVASESSRQFPPLRIRGGQEGLRTPHNPPQPSLILREGNGRSVGLFAAFLTAISTFQIFYATETRMYTMYLFFALLTVWLFTALEEKQILEGNTYVRSYISVTRGKWTWLGFFGVMVILVWTHITAWMIIAALGIYLLIQGLAFQKLNFKQFIIHNSSFIILGALLALQFLPWGITFFRLKIAAPLSQGYFFFLPPNRNYFLDILETFLVFGENSAFVVTILSAVMLILLWFAVRGANIFSPCPRGRLRGGGSANHPLIPSLKRRGKP